MAHSENALDLSSKSHRGNQTTGSSSDISDSQEVNGLPPAPEKSISQQSHVKSEKLDEDIAEHHIAAEMSSLSDGLGSFIAGISVKDEKVAFLVDDENIICPDEYYSEDENFHSVLDKEQRARKLSTSSEKSYGTMLSPSSKHRRELKKAAQISRDFRRKRSQQMALACAMLEQENLQLKAQIAILKNETSMLHSMIAMVHDIEWDGGMRKNTVK